MIGTHTFGLVVCEQSNGYGSWVPAIIELVLDEFDRLCNEQGWTTGKQRAAALGLDESTISRIKSGENGPGAAFIDACIATFGATAYPRLFRRKREEAETCAS